LHFKQLFSVETQVRHLYKHSKESGETKITLANHLSSVKVGITASTLVIFEIPKAISGA
jgi:hypothetical protein